MPADPLIKDNLKSFRQEDIKPVRRVRPNAKLLSCDNRHNHYRNKNYRATNGRDASEHDVLLNQIKAGFFPILCVCVKDAGNRKQYAQNT